MMLETFTALWKRTFHRQENVFHAISSYPTEILRSWKWSQTWQSDSHSYVWSDITPVLLSVNNPFVLNSFTLILLTVFSTSVSRGWLVPPWEEPSSQPLGSWPTSESMFDKGRVSPSAKGRELEKILNGEKATRKARGCIVHILSQRQTVSASSYFPVLNNENKPAYTPSLSTSKVTVSG